MSIRVHHPMKFTGATLSAMRQITCALMARWVRLSKTAPMFPPNSATPMSWQFWCQGPDSASGSSRRTARCSLSKATQAGQMCSRHPLMRSPGRQLAPISCQTPYVRFVPTSWFATPRVRTWSAGFIAALRFPDVFSADFWQLELPALTQKLERVLVNHLVDVLAGPAAAFHFQRGVRHVERNAHAPVARAVQPEPVAAVVLQHVNRPRRRPFPLRIQRHPAPKTRHHSDFNRVLL